MNKVKHCLLLATLILVAYAVGPGSALCRGQSGNCVCFPGGDTQDYEGSGATCSAASTSARSQAYAEVNLSCSPDGYCQRSYHVATPCYWDEGAGVYKEVGFARFRCLTCV